MGNDRLRVFGEYAVRIDYFARLQMKEESSVIFCQPEHEE